MMTRREVTIAIGANTLIATAASHAGPELVRLPPPRREGGRPMMEALRLRRSTRDYAVDRPVPDQVLSDLLWAAFGINRQSGERTAPYWQHIMIIDLYVARKGGVWLYEPQNHALNRHISDDIRDKTGLQDFVAAAPINLIYVAHGERMPDVTAFERRLYASVDSGFIGQNVYLFCASEGLATVFRGALDAFQLGCIRGLPSDSLLPLPKRSAMPDRKD